MATRRPPDHEPYHRRTPTSEICTFFPFFFVPYFWVWLIVSNWIMIAVVTKIKTTSIAQRFSKERKKHNWKKMRSEKKNRCSRFGLGAHNLANRIHIQLHLPEEICYLSCSSKWLFLRFFFSLSVSFCRSFYSFYLFSLIRFIFFSCCCWHRLRLCSAFVFARSTFSPSFGCFNDNVELKPVYFIFGE